MADSISSRLCVALVVVGAIVATAIGLDALTDIIFRPVVSAPTPGPCGCGGRCCQTSDPPGLYATEEIVDGSWERVDSSLDSILEDVDSLPTVAWAETSTAPQKLVPIRLWSEAREELSDTGSPGFVLYAQFSEKRFPGGMPDHFALLVSLGDLRSKWEINVARVFATEYQDGEFVDVPSRFAEVRLGRVPVEIVLTGLRADQAYLVAMQMIPVGSPVELDDSETAADRMSCYSWMSNITQDVTPYEWQFDGTPGILANYRIVPGAPNLLAVQVEILDELRNQWSVDLVDLYDVTANERITSTAIWCSKGQPGYDPFRSYSHYTLPDQDHEYRLELYLYPESEDAIRERDSIIKVINRGRGLLVHSDFAEPSEPLEIVLEVPVVKSEGGALK